MKKYKNIQLVHLYENGQLKGLGIALDGELVDGVLETKITSSPDAPLELTVRFALGLDGSDPLESSIRVDI